MGQFSSLFNPFGGCSERSWGGRERGHLPYPVPQFLPAPQNPAAPRGATASPFSPSLGSLASPCKQFFSWVKVIVIFFFSGMLKAGWTKAAGITCSGLGGEPQTPNLPCCSPASSRPGCPRGGRAEAARGRGGRNPGPGRAAALSAPFPAAASARGSK